MSIRRRHALLIRAELTGSATATALGISARSNSPILTLCRLLIRAGHNPSARLEAYRGSTLCLRVCSIGGGARLTVKEPDGGRAHFAKWTAFPSSPVASRAQEKELGGHGSPAAGRKAGSTPPESATRTQLRIDEPLPHGPRRLPQRVSATASTNRFQITPIFASRAISQKSIARVSNTLVVAPRKRPQLSPASNNGLALIGDQIRRGISRHAATTCRDASTSAAQSAP
jgi:hypothetical protein